MYIFLVSTVIGLFLAMLFVNLYFRMKVLKAYRILVENRVDFEAAHLFDRQKMEDEIISKHPAQRKNILTFVGFLQRSIQMASVLIALITLFGGILMYFR